MRVKLLKWLPWLLVVGLFAVAVIASTKMLQAQYDLAVSEANVRAQEATTLRWQTVAENAATRFQMQQEINEDSIKALNTALGHAIEKQELTLKSLQATELAFQSVQKSNEALLSLMNVLSPSGRPERLEVFVLDEDSIAVMDDSSFAELPIVGEIVVTIPADTLQAAEIETVLSLLPFKITTGLGCTPEKDAVAVFETPSWVEATPQMGQVEPEVCHGPRPNLLLGLKVEAGSLAIGAGLGAVITALLIGIF